MRTLLLALAMALPLPAVHAAATDVASVELVAAARQALNDAARQRMLTQRMVKAWCLIGLDNRNSNAQEQLFSAIEQFEEQLAELDVLAQAHGTLKVAVQRMHSLWEPFEAIVSAQVKRSAVTELLREEQRLLEATDQVVTQIVAITGSSYSRLVDLAGRQRMLSQRLLKAYMLLAWNIPDPQISEDFIASWNDFEERLLELHGLTENTPQLRATLAETEEQWRWVKSALSLSNERQFFPDIVDDAGEKILINLERLTKLYEQMILANDGQ